MVTDDALLANDVSNHSFHGREKHLEHFHKQHFIDLSRASGKRADKPKDRSKSRPARIVSDRAPHEYQWLKLRLEECWHQRSGHALALLLAECATASRREVPTVTNLSDLTVLIVDPSGQTGFDYRKSLPVLVHTSLAISQQQRS